MDAPAAGANHDHRARASRPNQCRLTEVSPVGGMHLALEWLDAAMGLLGCGSSALMPLLPFYQEDLSWRYSHGFIDATGDMPPREGN